MNCPHCRENVHEQQGFEEIKIGTDKDGAWAVIKYHCPSCERFVLALVRGKGFSVNEILIDPFGATLFRPKAAVRPMAPPEVPKQFSVDYAEACLVLPDSAQASAALSRRCLQHILREVEKVKHSDLFSEIQEVLNRGKLPSHIAESLDAVRVIGNFAAHPIKSTTTGEIVPVEAGEAEWNLDVLEALFDFYFVQPEILNKKKAALNAKLKDAGKQPMK
jgi:hypothetical protein